MDLELAETVKAAQKEAEKNGILGHGLHQPVRHACSKDVFEEMPWHLEEQAEQAIARGGSSGRGVIDNATSVSSRSARAS